METMQARRRNGQNRFWLVLMILVIVAVVYLLYKPSSKRKVQIGANNKLVVSPPKQSIIQKVQAVFQDPVDYDYETYDYSTVDMYFDNWQDEVGRPHYLAWDEEYTTTPMALDTEDEEKEESDELKGEDGQKTDDTSVKKEEVVASPEKQEAATDKEEATDRNEKPKDEVDTGNSKGSLLDKIKDISTKFADIGSSLSILKATDPLKIKGIEFLTSYRNPCFTDKASRFHCFPAFFIAGMPRCETKALHDILARHPSITAPDAHSPSFWTENEKISMEKYLDHFRQPSLAIKSQERKGAGDTKDSYRAVTFDSNPSLFWKGTTTEESFMTPVHLKHILPNSKVVIIVRDPIDRLYSEYMKFVPKGTPGTFHIFVTKSIENLKKCEVKEKKLFSCIHKDLGDDSKPHLETGMYYLFYQEWSKYFPKSQILVIRMEDFDASKKSTVKNVLNFLQVEDTSDTVLTEMVKEVPKSPSAELPAMKSDTKTILYDFYMAYNDQFADVLKNDALKYTQ